MLVKETVCGVHIHTYDVYIRVIYIFVYTVGILLPCALVYPISVFRTVRPRLEKCQRHHGRIS